MVERLKSLPFGVTTMLPGANPLPIGPYTSGKIIKTSEGIWGYTAGQIARSPETGDLVSVDKPCFQAQQALTNLRNLAEANGFDLSKHTIKTTVFLTKMSDFAECNQVYAKFFSEEALPARSCVAVKELPMGASFEIEAVLFKL